MDYRLEYISKKYEEMCNIADDWMKLAVNLSIESAALHIENGRLLRENKQLVQQIGGLLELLKKN